MDVAHAIETTLLGVVAMATRIVTTLYDYVTNPADFARSVSAEGDPHSNGHELPLTYATVSTVAYLLVAKVAMPSPSDSSAAVPFMQYFLRFMNFLTERIVSGGLEGLVLVVLPILAFYIFGAGTTVVACRLWGAAGTWDELLRVTCYGGGSYVTLVLPFLCLFFLLLQRKSEWSWVALAAMLVPVSVIAIRWSQLIKSISHASWLRTLAIIVTALALFYACITPLYLYRAGQGPSNSALQRTAPAAAAELRRYAAGTNNG